MTAEQPPVTDLASLLATPIFTPIPEASFSSVLNSSPFIPIPQALNLRTISSPNLPPNTIFRSGTLSHLPAASLATLKDKYNITTIFDLRGSHETARSPSVKIEGIETIWIATDRDFLFQGDGENTPGAEEDEFGKPAHRDHVKPIEFTTNEGEDGYVKLYTNFLHTHKEPYKAVFERLRDDRGGILIHCTAGKDRTGILAALILALVDAPAEEIATDYALTRIGIEPFREYLLAALLKQMGKTESIEAFEDPGMAELCGVRGRTILAVLEWMGRKWGSGGEGKYPGVEGYLIRELGLEVADVEKIRRNLAAGGV
ncbi:Tyrosine-protein phosphatase [Lachnellula hyalina]|uniref:Tyrosine-protein phosphatase n=1 Tax=Lachnellula hyalina TaxID=1316788 RepID=A0A8H8QWP0_9HELO|nr:Tyrosine-protein phosphatase [Lachnellula hyalina]TVY24128.1 Tyrosine-protein phosphatase [Lachnellula hyalina]